MRWILMFRKKGETGTGCLCEKVECTENELQGEKERIASELEERTGVPWLCATVVPFGERRRRDNSGSAGGGAEQYAGRP